MSRATFDEYKDRYQTIKMRRTDGILEMRFHTNDGPFQWSLLPHAELEQAFLDVGRDYDNEVVILTGTGNEYCGPQLPPGGHPTRKGMTKERYDPIAWESKHLIGNLLNIEVPVISAINGPAYRHSFRFYPISSLHPTIAHFRIVRISKVAWFPETASMLSFRFCWGLHGEAISF